MNASAAARRPSNRCCDRLTHVELTWLEKRIEHWIRFGQIAEEKILDRRRRIVSFTPGGVFAFVRWASNDFGTIISASTSSAQLRRENPTRRCHSSVRAATFCCGSPAGQRSIKFCRRSTWWKPRSSVARSLSGSIKPKRRSDRGVITRICCCHSVPQPGRPFRHLSRILRRGSADHRVSSAANPARCVIGHGRRECASALAVRQFGDLRRVGPLVLRSTV